MCPQCTWWLCSHGWAHSQFRLFLLLGYLYPLHLSRELVVFCLGTNVVSLPSRHESFCYILVSPSEPKSPKVLTIHMTVLYLWSTQNFASFYCHLSYHIPSHADVSTYHGRWIAILSFNSDLELIPVWDFNAHVVFIVCKTHLCSLSI